MINKVKIFLIEIGIITKKWKCIDCKETYKHKEAKQIYFCCYCGRVLYECGKKIFKNRF